MRSRFVLALLISAAVVPAAQAKAPPLAVTGGADAISLTAATLHGQVNPHGMNTVSYFQYGTTKAYGARTPNQSAGNGSIRIPVSAPIAGLAANTLYHFRLVATGHGTSIGADHTFVTTATPPPVIVPEPSKLELARATIFRAERVIDILAPITARASGNVNLSLFAAGQTHTWTAPINSADGRIRNREIIPPAQADKGTGILTITYPGDPDTRPQVVRLRAANSPANLDATRPVIQDGHLRDSGTISSRARGIVRVQLEYFSAGKTSTFEYNATINNGVWSLDVALTPEQVAAINTRRGTVHSYILFTGYLPAAMRGEMQSYEVLGAQ